MQHLKLTTIALLTLPLLFGGCSYADFVPAPRGQVFSRYDGAVRVLEALPPEGTYREVGMVIGKGGLIHGRDEMIRSMSARGARVGANAIVILGDRDVDMADVWSMEGVARMQAIAIRSDD